MLRRAVATPNSAFYPTTHREHRAPTIVTWCATDEAKERANPIPAPLSHCDNPYAVSVGCVQRLSDVTGLREVWSWGQEKPAGLQSTGLFYSPHIPDASQDIGFGIGRGLGGTEAQFVIRLRSLSLPLRLVWVTATEPACFTHRR
jgi:hypothetical protein